MKLKKAMIVFGTVCILNTMVTGFGSGSESAAKTDVFDIKDLPMIVSFFLVCVYLVVLFVMLFIHGGKKRIQVKATDVTRKINPKLGCLGVLGFLGLCLPH
jgi:Ca2+/H+ antiporter